MEDRHAEQAALLPSSTQYHEPDRRQSTQQQVADLPRDLHKPGFKTAQDHIEEVHSVSNQKPYWTSIWLTKITLCLFILMFAGLVAGLIVLWKADDRFNGFKPDTTHYAWTYGPTAVFTLVVSLWRQVDNHAKMLQPWNQLQQDSPASKSVLLDYITPLNVTSLYRSIMNRHVPVICSIVGFAILKLLLLFSTGLLVLAPTTVEESILVNLTSDFALTSAMQTALQYPLNLFSDDRKIPIYDLSSLPVHTYAGILNGQFSYPPGTTASHAFQEFQISNDKDILSTTLLATIFQPNISCEIASVNLLQETTTRHNSTVQLTTDTCSVGGSQQVQLLTYSDLCSGYVCPPQEIQYWFSRINCSQAIAPQDVEESMVLSSRTTYDLRYAFLVSNVTFQNSSYMVNQTTESDMDQMTPTNGTTQNSTWSMVNVTQMIPTTHQTAAVICKTDYYMGTGQVNHDMDLDVYNVSNFVPHQRFQNFTGLMLGEALYATLAAAHGLLIDGVSGYEDRMYFEITTPIYHMALQEVEGNQSSYPLLSAEILANAIEKSWNGIATQFMHENFAQPSNSNTMATIVYTEERLHVSVVSWSVMLAGCLLLICLSIGILLTARSRIVPHNPATIATYAVILTASPDMQQALHGAGRLRTSQLISLLKDMSFKIVNKDRFGIQATRSIARPLEKEKQWRPLVARWYMTTLTLLLPLVVIIVLEVIYNRSQRDAGLVDITGSEQQATYSSRYLAALIMFLTATCFTSLDSTIALFAPYSLLRSGNASARRSLHFQILGELPPVALWRSLHAGHLGSIFSNLAGLLGSTLTVVASGLFVVDRAVITQQPVQASLASTFDIAWYNSSQAGDGGAGVILNQVDWNETVMPTSIWENVVMPDISNISGLAAGSAGNFTFVLDSLRPHLDCEIVPDDQVTMTYNYSDGESVTNRVDAYTMLSQPECQHAGINGTEKAYSMYLEWFPPQTNQILYNAAFHDLHLGPWWYNPNASQESATGANEQVLDFGEGPGNAAYQADNQAGCPSIGMIFARDSYDAETPNDVTVLLCSQKIQQVTLQVTYSGKIESPSISTETTPVLVKELGYLTNGTEGIDTFPYRIETYLTTVTGNLTHFHGATDDDDDLPVDEFFDHVVNGLNGTSLEAMSGKANRQVMVKAVQRLYMRYMSLVIDQKFRQAQNNGTVVEGTVGVTSSRLQVNFVSKLVLQIMLGVMILLGALAFLFSDLRGTLPRKPSSIASTMGFLVDSDLCEHLVRSADGINMGNSFDGWFFSLGWWKTAGQMPRERRFGIDIGVPQQLGYHDSQSTKLRRRFTTSYRA